MPEDNIHTLRTQIKALRKQLSEMDFTGSEAKPDPSSDFWETFMKITLDLDRLEHALSQINQETVSEINLLRQRIVTSLIEYNLWCEKMHEMEQLFMLNILRPGYILKQAREQRKYLEGEYKRIRKGIIDGKYDSLQAVEAEVHQVLVQDEESTPADQREFTDEQVKAEELRHLAADINPHIAQETYNEEQILQDFKRIVLPAVHPDTSDTPQETFLAIYEAYETEDYLLMEAYVAQYRGEFKVDGKEDPLDFQETLFSHKENYHRLAGLLDQRLKSLKQELTPEELDDPEKLTAHLNRQQEALQVLIKLETEQVFKLREKIEGLIQLYLQIHSEDDHG